MKRFLGLLLLMLAAVSHAPAQTPVTGNDTASIRRYTTDPAHCSVGQFGLINIYYNTTSHVLKYCSATDTWATVGAAGGATAFSSLTGTISRPQAPGTSVGVLNVLYATDYSVKADGQACWGTNVGLTSSSSTVTCATASFTSADIGKTIFATSGCCGTSHNQSGSLLLPQGTISSVTNGTTVVASTTSNSTCSANATCALFWGTMDDTALTALDTAVSNAQGCPSVVFPAGLMLVQEPHFNAMSATCKYGTSGSALSTSTDYSVAYRGQGPGNTLFLIVPSFDLAACTNAPASGYGSSNGCFLDLDEVVVEDLGFYGGGYTLGGSHAQTMINEGVGSQFYNVSLTGFGGSATGMVGIQLNYSRFVFLSCDGFGSICEYARSGLSPANTTLYFNFAGDTNGFNLEVFNGNVSDFGSSYGTTSSTSAMIEVVGGTYNGYGISTISATTNTGAGGSAVRANGGNVNLWGGLIQNTCACNAAAVVTTGTIALQGVTLKGGSGGAALNLFGGGIGYDLGANNYSGAGTGVTVCATCKYYDPVGGNVNTASTKYSVTAGGLVLGAASTTGTLQTTGNIALTSGWDTSSKSAISGTSRLEQFTVTAAGTPGVSPVITVTFPTAFVAAPICSIAQVGGTFGTLTNPAVGTPSATSVAITFAGTPVAAQVYTFALSCDVR